MWNDLNQPSGASSAPARSEAQQRILDRLGDYAAQIITPLNLRPRAATLLHADDRRIEVRISTASRHVVLVAAPEGDLAPEVFFLRALSGTPLPVPQLIAYDLHCAVVPFTYAIESYVGGAPLDWLEPGPLMRVAARQLGRTLRRIHQLPAPGFGAPSAAGRWPTRGWKGMLSAWLAERGWPGQIADALGPEAAARLRAATIEHPELDWETPCVLHGAVGPARALVTVGDSAQLEALVQPDALVGGDPLFDLAHGLLPRHPEPFRQGLLEGYTATSVLTSPQVRRLRRLSLLLGTLDPIGTPDADAAAPAPELILRELAALEGA